MYRKFTATHIFNGLYWLPPNSVLITTADGTIVEITDSKNAGDEVEIFNGILTPGFINAHCHLELSHLKGSILEHTGLIDFVFKIITQRQADAATITAAIAKAESQMFQNGIVAVGDICNTTDTIEQKKYPVFFITTLLKWLVLYQQQRKTGLMVVYKHCSNSKQFQQLISKMQLLIRMRLTLCRRSYLHSSINTSITAYLRCITRKHLQKMNFLEPAPETF